MADPSDPNYRDGIGGTRGTFTDINSHEYQAGLRERERMDKAAAARWEAMLKPSSSGQSTSWGSGGGGGGGGGGSQGQSRGGAGFFGIVILLVLAGIWAADKKDQTSAPDENKPAATSENPLEMGGGQSLPKPPAGTPLVQPTQTQEQAQRDLQEATTGRVINDSTNNTPPTTPTDGNGLNQLPPVVPVPVETQTFSSSRDGFGNGCSEGELVLSATMLTFTCPEDASKSVTVGIDQGMELDNNGISAIDERNHRDKFHFRIRDNGRVEDKERTAERFRVWLSKAKPGANPF